MNIFFWRIWLITFVWVNCLHVHTGLRKSLQSQKSWDLRSLRLWDVDVGRRLRGSPTLTSSTSATPTVTLQVSHSYSPHTHTHTPKKKNEAFKVTLPVCQYLFPYKITPSKKKFIFMIDWSMNTLNFWISETKFHVVLSLNTEINKAVFRTKKCALFSGNTRPPFEVPFCDVLKNTLTAEQNMQTWCNVCDRYQPHVSYHLLEIST